MIVLPDLPSVEKFVVGFSGGLDSTVLLHLLSSCAPEKTIAVHVNHGLSKNADAWQQHCQSLCQQLTIPFFCEQVNATAQKGESPENAARLARYETIAKYIEKNSCLLTAHTQDDQAETFLLQAFRGAGPKGLASMPRVTSFADGLHCRPLLNATREQLEQYAQQHKLTWVEDESNQQDRFDRNYIRANVLPVIKQRWSSALQSLTRAARHCAQTDELLTQLAQVDLSFVQSGQKNTVSIERLLTLSSARQTNVLRFWLATHGVLMPSEKQLQQIFTQMIHSKPDTQPHITLNEFELRRYRNELFLLSIADQHDSAQTFVWQTSQPLQLPNGLGTLQKEQLKTKNCPNQVTVRFRQGGEVLGSKTLKNLFQQWGVPPWLRSRIPLIYDKDTLIEVVGYGNLSLHC